MPFYHLYAPKWSCITSLQTTLDRVLHKIALFAKAIIAPEFIAVKGLQDRSQAKATVEECKKSTGGSFELVHAFYVDMLTLGYPKPRGNRLESMTLSYVPLLAIAYLLRWIKPKNDLTPSVVKLPTRSEEQRATFEPMAVSYAFDDERIGNQGLLWSVWSLTPRKFEKEAEKRSLQESHQLMQESEVFTAPRLQKATVLNEATTTDYTAKETVVAQWDPKV
ncbi:MAG: hypothetical protein LQ341_004929 [Variospora aurantia]|nr:MAG: hypothetical protein LQ341_004929 [Variospora aurantia]